MAPKVTVKEKEIAQRNRKLVDEAIKAEDDKEYSTLRFAEFLHEVKENNAQVAENFEPTSDGFVEFCNTKLRTGYATAMRYIAIHGMRVRCGVDPAVAEDLGYSKLRAIAGVANPDNINLLIEQAQNLTTVELEKWVKAYKNQENPHGGDTEEKLPLFKKYIFPASEEEVPIISSALKAVGAMLGITNDTKILVHICQSYMEHVHSSEHTQKVQEIRKGVTEGKTQKEATKPASEKQEKKKTKDIEETKVVSTSEEDIIKEDQIIKASLPELIAFAEHHGISLDPKISGNKTKVKSFLIQHLADASEVSKVDDIPEPVVEDTPEEVSEEKDTKKGKKTSTKETSAQETKKKAGDDKKKASGKDKQEKIEEVLPDPADNLDVEEEISITEAIAEIRGVKNKKELEQIAATYGIAIPAADMKSKDADTLMEDVVKALCEEYQEEYIPPSEDDGDLDEMLKGD